MKRSVNFAYTRAARSYRVATALFLQDLGVPPDGIKSILDQMQTGKPEPSDVAAPLLDDQSAIDATAAQ